MQDDLSGMPGKDRARDTIEAEVADLHRETRVLGEDLKMAIGIGGGTRSGSFYLDGRPLQWLSIGVNDRTTDDTPLGCRLPHAVALLEDDGLAADLIVKTTMVAKHTVEERAERQVRALTRHVGD